MTAADDADLRRFGTADYLRLTTFRRDGTPVSTPVWPVLDRTELGGRDGDVLVTTGAESGKVKRLRHTSRVGLAICDGFGRVEPGVVDLDAEAEVLDDAASYRRARGLLVRRLPVWSRAIGLVRRAAVILAKLRRRPQLQEVVVRIHRIGDAT